MTSPSGSSYLASFEPAMRLALAEAAAAPAGDVPVGAVVLSAAGEVLSAASNRREADADPAGHAEVIALRSAGAGAGRWRLDGCTLVVTLEPCVMCAGAIAAARVERLVYGAPDERAGAAGSVWDLLEDRRLGPGVEVIGGVLAAECAGLLSAFFRQLRNPGGGGGGGGSETRPTGPMDLG